jgi:hypothetical protein
MLRRTAHRTAGRTVKGRTMRRTPPTRAHRIATALVLAAAVIAAGAVSAPAKSVRAPGCTLKRAKTIKANRDVRVFRTVPVAGSGTVYGCRRRAARAYVLGEFGECQNNHEIRRVEVAGRRTALGAFECSLDSGAWDVELVNLASGRLEFRSAPLVSPLPDAFTFDELQRIVATSDGALAWTATRRARGALLAVEVRRRMRGTATASLLLDSGTDIDPESLRKRGRTLSWTKAGVRRTATF